MAKARTSDRTLVQVKYPDRDLDKLDDLVGYMDEEYRGNTIIRATTLMCKLHRLLKRHQGADIVLREEDGTEHSLILV